MKTLYLALALLAYPGAAGISAAQPGFRTEFVGGTLGISPKSSARLDLSGTRALVLHTGGVDIQIEYRKVESIEYGQNVSRRYAAAVLISPMLLLSKSRKHFVTLGYRDEEGKPQAVVFRVGKGDIRSVLASLEVRTGRRIEYQDDEARKGNR